MTQRGRRTIVLTREQIVEALEAADHDLEGAARQLGISWRTLYRRMAEFGIRQRRTYEPAEVES